ncbi:Na+/H+ antiporter NhaC [Verrucomicrobia bacterium]|nr:Na+/H+ antiporter NhaC [Verrucomicrobiota bacterium]
MNKEPKMKKVVEPSLMLSMVPVVVLMVLLGGNVFLFEGTAHIPLMLATAVVCLVSWRLGYQWDVLEEGMLKSVSVSMKAILILLIIGVLIGLWIAGGIVPSLIYYGLQLMSPGWFLPGACLVCAAVSLSTGSSWTTAGTVGIALIGVGDVMGIPVEMCAGAVISGAYFGDKMSPLSDTTNLAPAVAGSELFEHIRHMVWTTVPALVISLVLYFVLGLFVVEGAADAKVVGEIQGVLSDHYVINPLLILPAVLIGVMVVKKIPAIPAMMAATLFGGVLALLIQEESLKSVFEIAFVGVEASTESGTVDSLLNRGGLVSMMETTALIICAMCFGGAMESSGMLKTIANSVLKFAHSTGSLIVATVCTCFGMNVIAADQYLAIVVPGRMYKDAYRKQGLAPVNLSRTLEDAGTLSSPLVPWTTCGAFMSSTLDVSVGAYFPFVFLAFLTPMIAIYYGFSGRTIIKLSDGNKS